MTFCRGHQSLNVPSLDAIGCHDLPCHVATEHISK